MEGKELERKLGEFDFSLLSTVRGPLLHKLLSMRRSQGSIAEGSGSLWTRQLDDEALDMVVAAGNPIVTEKSKDKNKR